MRALLAIVSIAASLSAQALQWIPNPLNGHSYALTPLLTWMQAEQLAVAQGGHLATVRSAAEHNWLVQTFGVGAPDDTRIWIGLTDAAVEGTWVWSSGEPVAHTNWGLFEPDNAGDQDHAALWLIPLSLGGGWYWSDDQGANGRIAIIEVPVSAAASYSNFGAGCVDPFAQVPSLDGVAGEPPVLGTTSRIRVSNLPLSVTVPIFVLGLSNTMNQGPPPYALPLDLGIFGWQGCQQLVSLDTTSFAITTSGQADYAIIVPSNGGLIGFTFHAQAIVLYHPSGVAVTNGVTGVVGY